MLWVLGWQLVLPRLADSVCGASNILRGSRVSTSAAALQRRVLGNALASRKSLRTNASISFSLIADLRFKIHLEG